jgi:hypothetical protein
MRDPREAVAGEGRHDRKEWATSYNKHNNKHAYAGTDDCFTHPRVLLVLQAPRRCGPI